RKKSDAMKKKKSLSDGKTIIFPVPNHQRVSNTDNKTAYVLIHNIRFFIMYFISIKNTSHHAPQCE
ncbi:MAG: hypothetical protein AAGK47_01205, partial [Bacteroidota bacterium]